jgi:hypothetical protein
MEGDVVRQQVYRHFFGEIINKGSVAVFENQIANQCHDVLENLRISSPSKVRISPQCGINLS